MKESLSPYLIVGLGNIGEKHLMNRHNIGFFAIDFLCKQWKASGSWAKEHQAMTLKLTHLDKKIILAKPQTYMNSSGEAVQPLMAYYKVSLSHILVIHDDLDIPFSTLKLITNRGHGGQNGIRSIHERLGTPNYARLKCGIGRPPHPDWSVADWVLSNWTQDEILAVNNWLNEIEKAVTAWLNGGVEKAANQINSKRIN